MFYALMSTRLCCLHVSIGENSAVDPKSMQQTGNVCLGASLAFDWIETKNSEAT